MDNFFSRENQAAPPALSTCGKMRFGVKADLLHCLESNLLEGNVNSGVPISDATILDGAAVVQMLNPKGSRTFQEYGESVFGPYIYYIQLEKSNRVDIVWNVYRPNSLKASTLEKREKGTRRR